VEGDGRETGVPDDIEVIVLDHAQYNQAVKASLRDVGLTYPQLRAQARKGRFSSLRARKLWLAIGEPGSADPGDIPDWFFDDEFTPEVFAAEQERYQTWVAAGRPGAMTSAEVRRRLFGEGGKP